MRYKIYCDDKLVASFLHAADRNTCFDVLKEKYDDCTWTREDE